MFAFCPHSAGLGSKSHSPGTLGAPEPMTLTSHFPPPHSGLCCLNPHSPLPSHSAPAKHCHETSHETSQRPVRQRRESKFPASLPRLLSQGKWRKIQHLWVSAFFPHFLELPSHVLGAEEAVLSPGVQRYLSEHRCPSQYAK